MADASINAMKIHLNSVSPIPEIEWPHFERHLKFSTHKKGEVLLRAGDFDSRMALITKGLVKRSS